MNAFCKLDFYKNSGSVFFLNLLNIFPMEMSQFNLRVHTTVLQVGFLKPLHDILIFVIFVTKNLKTNSCFLTLYPKVVRSFVVAVFGMPHPLSPAEIGSILLRAFKIILFELKIKRSSHTYRTACKKFEIVCSIITQDFLLDLPDPQKHKQLGFHHNYVLTTTEVTWMRGSVL